MNYSNTDILLIYNSRKTLIDVFYTLSRDLNIPTPLLYEYNSNINEVEAMAKNDQLDMFLPNIYDNRYDERNPDMYNKIDRFDKHESYPSDSFSFPSVSSFNSDDHNIDSPSIYVKYMLTKSTIRLQAIDDLVEFLFDIEKILTKSDTLVIVVNDEPNESMIAKLKYLYDNRGIFIVMHNIHRLQQNILKHSLVPKHRGLAMISRPKDKFDTKTNTQEIMDKYKLKSLSQLPEISRFDPIALLIMLRPGQVCEIERKSVTSVSTLYYRICV